MSEALAICPRCGGYGTVANPAFDGMSTSELRDDLGDEEADDFLTEYTRRGGMYDISCPRCKGDKVVPRCKGTGCLAARVDIEDIEHCDDHLTRGERRTVQEISDMYAEMEAERRMGA